GQIDARGEVARRQGGGADHGPRVAERVGGGPLDHQAGRPIAPAPDDGPIASDVAALHAVGGLRPVAVRRHHRRRLRPLRRPRQSQGGAAEWRGRSNEKASTIHGWPPGWDIASTGSVPRERTLPWSAHESTGPR